MDDIIESVEIIIRTKDNKCKEIPLEVWQVGAIADALGLHLKLPDLDDYQMLDEKEYEKRRKEQYFAIKYLYKNIREAVRKILSQYGVETRKDFYEKNQEDVLRIYEQLELLQQEYNLTKKQVEELVEDIVHILP